VKFAKLQAFVLAGMIAANSALVPVGVVKATTPAAPPAVAAQAAPAASISTQMPSGLSASVQKQTEAKAASRDQLAGMATMGGALPGMKADPNQPAVAGVGSKLGPDEARALAYVLPYQEPNDFAHRNYCGAGAATVLMSHFDANFAHKVNIDQVGRDINLDPDSGAWIKDIAGPVNDYLSQYAGHKVDWYRPGQAQSKDDLRWMLNVDIVQNGVPLITGVNTGGLPGWGGQDVGHIIAVNGYWKDANGKEWVSYVDTAPPASGYQGERFVTVSLDTFWQAVSGNSAQVW
jgi:hypothetical protein